MIKNFSIKKIIAIAVVLFFQMNQIVWASDSLKGHVVYLPENSSFEAVMQSSLDSELLTNGDVISAVINKNWKENDALIAPKGSILYGKIIDIEKPDKYQKSGSFTVEFNELVTPTGKINIKTKPIKITSNAKRGGKIIAKFICGCIVGAAIVGMTIMSAGLTTPVAIGYFALMSGSTGLAYAAEKGNSVKIPAGTRFYAHLEEATTLTFIE